MGGVMGAEGQGGRGNEGTTTIPRKSLARRLLARVRWPCSAWDKQISFEQWVGFARMCLMRAKRREAGLKSLPSTRLSDTAKAGEMEVSGVVGGASRRGLVSVGCPLLCSCAASYRSALRCHARWTARSGYAESERR